ncbi:MAG: FIST C-terminal domain-containing protein [Bermanella sp.]
MQIEQYYLEQGASWQPTLKGVDESADLLLCFGPAATVGQHMPALKLSFPNAVITGCTTAGEILDDQVRDDSISLSALSFNSAQVKAVQVKVAAYDNSQLAGHGLAQQLPTDNLRHVLIFSDGLVVNGTDLAKGLTQTLPPGVSVSGGLAGDGDQFTSTATWLDGPPQQGHIVAVGLYGSSLKLAYSSFGGWDPFGPDRVVTKADGNVLFELDGRSALELYKEYLGPHAQELPGSALLFPLSIRADKQEDERVRTILAVDDEQGSMTFAGDIPQGCRVRLMRANFDRLIDGATIAAQRAVLSDETGFVLLISCVGRKMVLKQRVEEEVEGVRQILGEQVSMAGFYSYGELSPLIERVGCTLHNQTMTVTSIGEK